MGSIFELTNPNNWEQIYNQSFTAEIISPQPLKYRPIPEIAFPLVMQRHIIVCGANSSTAPPNWRFAGFVDQRLRFGLTVGGAYDGNAYQKKIWLKRNTLIIFPRLTPDYSFSIKIPYWIDQIELIFWQYIGIENDSTELALAAMSAKLDEINGKI